MVNEINHRINKAILVANIKYHAQVTLTWVAMLGWKNKKEIWSTENYWSMLQSDIPSKGNHKPATTLKFAEHPLLSSKQFHYSIRVDPYQQNYLHVLWYKVLLSWSISLMLLQPATTSRTCLQNMTILSQETSKKLRANLKAVGDVKNCALIDSSKIVIINAWQIETTSLTFKFYQIKQVKQKMIKRVSQVPGRRLSQQRHLHVHHRTTYSCCISRMVISEWQSLYCNKRRCIPRYNSCDILSSFQY